MEPRPNSSITKRRGEQRGGGAHHGGAVAAHPWSVVLHPSGDNCSFMAGNHITSQSKEWRVREEEETEGKKTWMASEQWWRGVLHGRRLCVHHREHLVQVLGPQRLHAPD